MPNRQHIRAEFEKHFPKPRGIYWSKFVVDGKEIWDYSLMETLNHDAILYLGKWQGFCKAKEIDKQ